MGQRQDFVMAIKVFLRLQTALLDAFFQKNPGQHSGLVFFPPVRSGTVFVEGQEWSWQVHGAGVRFLSPSRVAVDVHTILARPSYFDSWRLRVYFGSLGRTGVKLLERTVGRQGPLDDLIESAIAGAAGRIVAVEPGVYKLCDPD